MTIRCNWAELNATHLRYIHDACQRGGEIHELKAFTSVLQCAHWANVVLNSSLQAYI